jgi:biotin operon repressor
LKEVQLMPVPDGRVVVMYAEWVSHPDTGVDEIAVLTVLALHADRKGVCWPSQALLARLLNRSRPWVNKTINRLCEIGLLIKTRRHRDDGGNRSCLYRLVHPSTDDTPGKINQELTERTPSHQTPPCPVDYQEVSGDDSLGSVRHHRKNPSEQTERDTLSATVTAGSSESFSSRIESAILPSDWQPRQEDLLWAKNYFPDVDLTHHTNRFKARCHAKGYCYRDPGAAWRAWLLDDAVGSPNHHQATGRHGPRFDSKGKRQPSSPPSSTYQRWQVWGQFAAEGADNVA